MSKIRYRVPKAVVENLLVSTALGGFGPDHLIAAAIWAFSRQDQGLKNLLVREFWFRGSVDESPRRPARRSLKEKLYGLVARVLAGLR
jgi:hypothetical protein